MADGTYGSLRRLASCKSLRTVTALTITRSAHVITTLKDLKYDPRAMDKAVEALSGYIVAKQRKGRSSSDILRRLQAVKTAVPKELHPAFMIAREETNMPLSTSFQRRPHISSSSSSSSITIVRRASVSSGTTAVTIRTPKSSKVVDDIVDIFSPRPGQATCLPSIPRLDFSCAPDDHPFAPLVIDHDFMPFAIRGFDSLSIGGSESDWDPASLDDFPLPPSHLPHVRGSVERSQTDSTIDTVRPMYLLNGQDRRHGLGSGHDADDQDDGHEDEDDDDDDDDDSRTITAVTPTSTDGSWPIIWNTASSDDTFVDADRPSKASMVREEYFKSCEAPISPCSQLWADRRGLAL